MQLVRQLAGECDDDVTCPEIHLTDTGALVCQGAEVSGVPGLRPGPGETAIVLDVALVREALRALDA